MVTEYLLHDKSRMWQRHRKNDAIIIDYKPEFSGDQKTPFGNSTDFNI